MYYREVEVLRSESIATLGTRTVDLNITDPISKISVIWKKFNTNSTPLAHPGNIVKNILVCDGADVLFSMNGSHAQSMAYYTDNIQPASIINYVTGECSVQCAEIKFGRWLYDELLALDPKRYNNLQIKVEHDLILGGSTGAVANLSIYAHCFDEKVIEPQGFLYNKEIYTFLPVAGSWYYIDIPTDYPVRALMWGAENATDGPNFIFDEFKLTENQGKHILIDSEMHRYMYQTSAYYDPWNEIVYAKTAGADTDLGIFITPHFERQSHLLATVLARAVANQSAAGCTQNVRNATGAEILKGIVMGHCPFGAMFLKTFGGDKIEDCWQIAYTGSGRLEIHAVAGLAAQLTKYQHVYVQQVRTY